MKAITPVIAIVVLLLMTISAGGLAYLTLTSYQEEAARSGLAGAESTFESMGEQVRIESVQDGQVIVRNVGSRAIEDFEPLLLIDGVPVQTSSNKVTLLPGETAVLDMRIEHEVTQAPQVMYVVTPNGNTVEVGHEDRCTTVEISIGTRSFGVATPACYYSLNLVACNINGVCETQWGQFQRARENAFNCPKDCGFLMIVASLPVTTAGENDVYHMFFNGTNWKLAYNITDSAGVSEGVADGVYDSSRNIMAIWQNQGIMYNNLTYSFNSSGGWSAPANTTLDKVGGNIDIAEGPNGQMMVTAQARPDTSSIEADMVKSILWDGDSWGPMKNVSISTYTDLGRNGCGFWPCHAMFHSVGYYGTTPIAVWIQDVPGSQHYAQSAVWDGSSWTNYKNISTKSGGNKPSITTNLNGEVMAIWVEDVGPVYTGPYQVRSVIWNGASWSAYQNVTEPVDAWTDVRGVSVARDALGQYIVTYMNQTNNPNNEGYYVVRSKSGVWGAPMRISPLTAQYGEGVYLMGNLAGAITVTWPDFVVDHIEYMTAFWNPYEARLQLPIHALYCDVAGELKCRETDP